MLIYLLYMVLRASFTGTNCNLQESFTIAIRNNLLKPSNILRFMQETQLQDSLFISTIDPAIPKMKTTMLVLKAQPLIPARGRTVVYKIHV